MFMSQNGHIWVKRALVSPHIANNNKYVRGKKLAREDVERFCLAYCSVEKLDPLTYQVKVPHQTEEELNKNRRPYG
jgi:hypothetical protein